MPKLFPVIIIIIINNLIIQMCISKYLYLCLKGRFSQIQSQISIIDLEYSILTNCKWLKLLSNYNYVAQRLDLFIRYETMKIPLAQPCMPPPVLRHAIWGAPCNERVTKHHYGLNPLLKHSKVTINNLQELSKPSFLYGRWFCTFSRLLYLINTT